MTLLLAHINTEWAIPAASNPFLEIVEDC